MKCILLALLVSVVSAASFFSLEPELNSQEAFDEWNEFKQTHGKEYETPEKENLRFFIYRANKRMIDDHNEAFHRGEHSFSMEVNEFADLLPSEFAALRNGFKPPHRSPSDESSAIDATFLRLSPDIALPDSVDWRTVGAVTAVQDQGSCGSCWAFSAAGALEGQHFRKSGRLVNLSEQNLVDCAGPFGAQGCEGGWMRAAFSYVDAQGGVDTEASYPYEADDDGPCRFSATDVGASDVGFVGLPHGDEEALKEAVAVHGPVSVAMDASRPSFTFYSGGVYSDRSCSSRRLTHAMLVVGYGTDEHGGDFWLVKNSWSPSWGEAGYVRMARNRNNACGIASGGVYPLV